MNFRTRLRFLVTPILLGTSIIYSSCVSLDADKKTSGSNIGSEIESPEAPAAPVKTGNSEEMLMAAFQAFEQEDYEVVIAQADVCISNFAGDALRRQTAFTESGNPSPPTEPNSDEEKQEIFDRGPLNDVAGCYFTKGEALKALGQYEKAKEAYTGAMQFPAARIWDPGGFFWKPAEASSDRLTVLN